MATTEMGDMMAEYSDYRCQDAYEAGVRDAVAELEPSEPDQPDREWFDNTIPPQAVDALDRERETAEYDRMREEWQREDIADALDHFWNGPR